MHTINTLRRVVGLIGLAVLLVSVLGCNKMLANYSVSSAQKRVAEAKEHMAEKFSKTLLEDANNKINTASQKIQLQQYKEARVIAKEAADVSKTLLEESKVAHAKYLKDQANRWLDRAKLNKAESIDQIKNQQIQATNEAGLQQIDKQKYDRAIATFTKVIDDVQFLLRNLETDANDGLKETKKMLDELIQEGAKEHAAEFVTALNNSVAQIQDQINNYNYRAAIDTRDTARQVKQEGIQKTKEHKSQKQISEIENLLDTATNLKADIYALQDLKSISKEFQNLLTQFYEKKYDTVLATAPQLKPKVENLIVETKRESARARIQSVEKAIHSLEDSKARQYLPGRVERLDDLLTQARGMFDKGQKEGIKVEDFYTKSQGVSDRALELNQSIIQEFDTLAQQEYNKASEALGKAEGVFNTMQAIFDKASPGELGGEDKTLEVSKHAMKEELRAQLKNAQLSLSLASLKREDKDFDTSIETAKQVAQSAENVRQQTYRVVAHNAIMEIASQLTHFEREGGREYAAAEMNKTLGLLEKSKGLLHGGQYREAVRQAADTKAQLEILVQELERVALKKIEDAQQALGGAKQSRAETYQSQAFNQATVSLDRAKASLEGEGLQQAIESARQAETLAATASEKSLRQWAEDERRRTDLLLGQAREAGAEQYAPEQLQKATDQRKNLEQLFNQGSYHQAIAVGEQAVEAANGALYAKVNEAENDIATAKRNDGWQREPDRMAQAIVSAKNAREALEQGHYTRSLEHAQNAVTVAGNVARDAKRKAFDARMVTLEQHLDLAQRAGAGYYQVKDISKILSEMNRMRNEYNGSSYEDLNQKIELLESQLAGVMEMTPDVLKDLVGTMQTRLDELDKRGARKFMPDKVEEVERKIKYAQIDYKGEKFRPSFGNAKDAAKALDAIELNLDEREYDAALTKELQAFNAQVEKFSPLLNVGSPAMIQMAIGPQGRSQAVAMTNAASPSDLRAAITEIGARVQQLTPPPTRRENQEAAIKLLTLAKAAAGNFEKILILDQYQPKDARSIIETAFLQMLQARTQQQTLQRAIPYPQTQLQPAGVERIVTYKGE